MEVCHFAEKCHIFLSLTPFDLQNIDPRSPKLHIIKFTGVSFRLPSLVILALIEAEIAERGRISPPPFPGRVILRPFPVRVLRNRKLQFWTTVNLEVEYYLNEETVGVLTDTVIYFYDQHLTWLSQLKPNVKVG